MAEALCAQRPSVAVLPFENLSGDPGQDYFADGITEDLITDLAKLSVSTSSPATPFSPTRERPSSWPTSARDLGVRFVVDGSVRRTGDQIRLNAQLIDMATGDNLWADRFDRGAAEVFAVQDEMSREIAKALGMQPSAAESERMARPPTANLEAYDDYLRAEQAARTGRARRAARGACALRQGGRASTLLSPWPSPPMRARPSTSGVHPSTTSSKARLRANEPTRRRAGRCSSIRASRRPTPFSPSCRSWIAVTRRRSTSAKRAVALGPGDAEAQIALGYVQLFAGNRAEAAAAVEAALRLDPNLSAIDREDCRSGLSLPGRHARRPWRPWSAPGTTRRRPAAFASRSPRPMQAPAVCRMRKRQSPKASA